MAATRGRDTNTLCVITDSYDITEARDLLEAILAVDRADVPATTQRRTLAQATPRAAASATSTPRCQSPEWFPTALADAHSALRDAEGRQVQQAGRREQATGAATRADSVLADVAAETAPDRDALHHADTRAVEARRRQAAAQHRLDTAPRRHRRRLRQELRVAEQQQERAEDYLERTRRRAGPAVERHTQAVVDQRAAHDRLRDCDIIDRLDEMGPSVGEHRLHVRALNTWKHWADGHDVPNGALHTAWSVLAHRPGPAQQLGAALRHDLGTTQVNRDTRAATRSETAAMPVARPDLGIEM